MKTKNVEFVSALQNVKIVNLLASLHIPWTCGICECITKSLGYLEIHLAGCEIYKCASNDDLECDYKVKTLSEIRKHIKNEHKRGYFKHVQIKRNDPNELIFTKYWFDGKEPEKQN